MKLSLFEMPDCASNVKYRVYNLLLRFVVFCAHVTIGMFAIVAIEKTGSQETEEKQLKSKFLSDLQINMTLKYNLTRKEFILLADAIYHAKSNSPLQWTYIRGFSFAIQLLTTIGYGNITPVTDGGKVFTIFFALFGIPITLLFLSSVGEEMLNYQKYVIKKMETRWLKKHAVSYLEVKCLFTALAIILLWILAGVIFSLRYQKDWSFLDSLYCWFITFTTVGFGDYIPAHGSDGLRNVAAIITFTIYVMLGLCAMSNLLNIVGEFASRGIFRIRLVSNTAAATETDNKENKVTESTEDTRL